ncbi:hypothetical protein niasHT_003956 [Heterodera trifolii]|uniref:Uncharacterized protein n=1 Tax=Heterodera trifolii TaxID=157864 RepID=A0ABD2M4Z7_9BILA
MVTDLEQRIKACEFIVKNMIMPESAGFSMPMLPFFNQMNPGQSSSSSSSSSSNWLNRFESESSNQSQLLSNRPLQQQNSHPFQGTNLAKIYIGQMLRNLRQHLIVEPGNGGNEEEKRTIWKKRYKNSVEKFMKKFKPEEYVEKMLHRQDNCFQKLATDASMENGELIITVNIVHEKHFEKLKKVIAHGGEFIERIAYHTNKDLTKMNNNNNNNVFEQLFVAIMNLKFSVYAFENSMMGQQLMGGNMANYGKMPGQPMGGNMANYGMMPAQYPNNGPTLGHTMANYGMMLGATLGNMAENVFERGKELVAKMNNNGNQHPFSGMPGIVVENNTNNNNNNNSNYGNMPSLVVGVDSTVEYSVNVRSRMVEDIGIEVQGVAQWPKKLLAKLFEEQLFEGLLYKKGTGANRGSMARIPHWEAMLGLSPQTKAILQFCKNSTTLGPGLKFRSRIKRKPENAWQHFKETISQLVGSEEICF